MKKILLWAVIALLAFGAAACQKKDARLNAGNIGVSVRLLTDSSGVDDKSFNAAVWGGIINFYGDTLDTRQKGGDYDWVSAEKDDMNVPVLRQASDEGYDLIVAAGFMWADAVEEVAAGNPNQNYLIVDVGYLSSPNVMQAVFAEHEGSYLVGVAAALKALEDGISNPRFGFIGGEPDAVITKFEVGYVQGILSVIPNAGIVDYYVNSWDDAGLAKTQAKGWYDSGVYAIYSAAGNSGNGAIAQANEYRRAGRNVWAIGVDSDQFEDGIYNDAGDSAVLTSMLKRADNSVLYALNAIRNNTFSGEVVVFDLAGEGVGFSTANSALSEKIVDELDVIKKRIINGEITIASTLRDAVLLPGFPKNLRAVDN